MKTCDVGGKWEKYIIILGRLVLNQPRYYNSFFYLKIGYIYDKFRGLM
jgi:hypothetical protein